MSERAVRRLDRVAREAPPDVLDAVRAGTLSVKAADRLLVRPGVGHVPTGPVRAREAQPDGDGRPHTTNPAAADGPREISAPAGAPPSIPPAVEAFMAVCRALHEATKDFVRDTAHWTGERREQRNFTIWQGIRQLEEHLEWMESAGEARPGAI